MPVEAVRQGVKGEQSAAALGDQESRPYYREVIKENFIGRRHANVEPHTDDTLAHRYGCYMTDMVWAALEANEILPSEYAKILAQNPTDSEVICLWDPEEGDADDDEEEPVGEPDDCGRDTELGNQWEVRVGETVVVSFLPLH